MEEGLNRKQDGKTRDDWLDRLDVTRDEICFVGRSDHYCVGVVDMVDSTKITLGLGGKSKVQSYYAAFLNPMARIVRAFEANVVKTVGDALIFYFPATADSASEIAFVNVLKCLTAMLEARDEINKGLFSMRLPAVSYRISADYGMIDFASSKSQTTEDLYGTTMNLCSKINSAARENSMVIGGDLYRIIKPFKFEKAYQFREVKSSSFGFKFSYPVYSVEQRDIAQYDHGPLRHDLLKAPGLAQSSPAREKGKKAGSRIMLVDDNEDMLFTFESYLAAYGHHVDSFSHPGEAVRHFADVGKDHYRLVVLDLKMPGIDGIQAHRMLREIDSKVRVLFVSALDTSADLVNSVSKASLQALLLRKPVDKERFVRAVNALLA